jgi:hypothetical protein
VVISVSVLQLLLQSCTAILHHNPVAHPFRGEAFSPLLKCSAGFHASPHASNLYLSLQG